MTPDDSGWTDYYKSAIDLEIKQDGRFVLFLSRFVNVDEIQYGRMVLKQGGEFYRPSEVDPKSYGSARAYVVTRDEFDSLPRMPQSYQPKGIVRVSVNQLSKSLDMGLNGLPKHGHMRKIRRILNG